MFPPTPFGGKNPPTPFIGIIRTESWPFIRLTWVETPVHFTTLPVLALFVDHPRPWQQPKSQANCLAPR